MQLYYCTLEEGGKNMFSSEGLFLTKLQMTRKIPLEGSFYNDQWDFRIHSGTGNYGHNGKLVEMRESIMTDNHQIIFEIIYVA